jgi:uncharacterized glyoxalase superfamily protein PhnB
MSQSSPNASSIHEVFAYLIVRDAAAAIDFYRKAFGAEEAYRLSEPNGRVGHAELKFGPTTVMLADEYPEHGIQSPLAFGGAGVRIHLHVDNADRVAAKAVEAGATMLRPPTDEFYGERGCRIRDPFGHEWLIGHQIENVSHEEMQRRFDAMFQK